MWSTRVKSGVDEKGVEENERREDEKKQGSLCAMKRTSPFPVTSADRVGIPMSSRGRFFKVAMKQMLEAGNQGSLDEHGAAILPRRVVKLGEENRVSSSPVSSPIPACCQLALVPD